MIDPLNRPDPAVEVEGVSRIFEGPEGPVVALSDIDLRVDHASMAAIRGRSGSGKTTLLNLIGALDTPTSGTVRVNGQRIDTLGPGAAARWRAVTIGCVFQAHALMPSMTALENVDLVLRISGIERGERIERAHSCLEQVGLADRMHHRPAELSGGQRQRVAVARAMASGNTLLIADEPTAGLDSQTATGVFTLLRSLVDSESITIVMATHDPLSSDFVDSAMHLERGTLVVDA